MEPPPGSDGSEVYYDVLDGKLKAPTILPMKPFTADAIVVDLLIWMQLSPPAMVSSNNNGGSGRRRMR